MGGWVDGRVGEGRGDSVHYMKILASKYCPLAPSMFSSCRFNPRHRALNTTPEREDAVTC